MDEFHFQVLYGNDFARPTIVDIEDIIVPFQTNRSIGSKEEPFMLLVPENQTGVEMTTHDPALKGGEKILRNGSLFILRNGRMSIRLSKTTTSSSSVTASVTMSPAYGSLNSFPVILPNGLRVFR